jgi:hypothetical protein
MMNFSNYWSCLLHPPRIELWIYIFQVIVLTGLECLMADKV